MNHDLLAKTRRHCSRAEVRKAMAEHLKERIVKLGGKATIEKSPIAKGRSLDLTFTFGRNMLGEECYMGRVMFDAPLIGGVTSARFVLSWYTRAKGTVYPPNFVAGEVNKYHFTKATTIADTFGELCTKVENGLDQLRTFMEPPK